jgi:hypothetical protein
MIDRSNLKTLVKRLREISDELESEIYSDTQSYTSDLKYEDVLEYYQNPASAEEGL